MERFAEEQAARFDEKADDCDESRPPENRTCADLVIAHAAPRPDDLVVDLGTGGGGS